MADIHFPAYLQVSKDCLYHNTCVLITALLTEIIFLQRILQECFLLPNHSRGDKEPSPSYYVKPRSPCFIRLSGS